MATRRTGKAGRPRVEDVDPDLPIRIFAEVGMIRWVETRRGRGWGQLRSYWTPPLAVLSKWFHVSPATILKLLDIPSPAGPTWREIFQDKREVFECSIWSPSRDYKDGLAEVEE